MTLKYIHYHLGKAGCVERGQAVLQGYLSLNTLTESEREVLYTAVCARFCEYIDSVIQDRFQQSAHTKLIVADLTPIFVTDCAMATDQIATFTQVRYISFLHCVKIFQKFSMS